MSKRVLSPWAEVIGPCYPIHALNDRLSADVEPSACMSFVTADLATLYPVRQFIEDSDTGIMYPEPKLHRLWREKLVPAIRDGILSDLTAVSFVLKPMEALDEASIAEKLANSDNAATEDKIEAMIGDLLVRRSQP